jgi:tetratricopeptide (TPR) repeat protein
VLSGNLRSISDSLIERRVRKEITNEEYRNLIAKAAAELVKEADMSRVDPAEAWQYGEVLRAARNWEAALAVFELAVKHAKATKNEDRRVNDTLRLAHVQAHLGSVQASIETASQVLDAKPTDSAPILLAVLYEIVPAARGKDHDLALAELLEGSIQKHLRTQVDTNTVAGKDFMAARSHHVSGAYTTLAALYDQLGMTARAEGALKKAERAAKDFNGFLESELAQSGSGEGSAPR